jgi:hypothetical protein
MEGLIGLALLVLIAYLLLSEVSDSNHEHMGHKWDGHREVCKCGKNAGDRRDPISGKRYTFFSEWPK